VISNKSQGSVATLLRYRTRYTVSLTIISLQIYCRVCCKRILKIHQHCTKLRVRKLTARRACTSEYNGNKDSRTLTQGLKNYETSVSQVGLADWRHDWRSIVCEGVLHVFLLGCCICVQFIILWGVRCGLGVFFVLQTNDANITEWWFFSDCLKRLMLHDSSLHFVLK